jgi:16S rRNA (uracil1498-N3)-methyltransferase
MNILILEKEEVGLRLPRSDRRWEHVKKVLKKGPGDRLAAGLLSSIIKAEFGDDAEQAAPLLGEATIRELDDSGLVLDFQCFEGAACIPPELAPVILVLGFPRPIQANRILKDLTSLGVAEIHLTGTELGEKSYAQSSIFKDKDFRAPLIEGAEQAGNPRLPQVYTHWTLARCLKELDDREQKAETRIFLHPYGVEHRLGELASRAAPPRAPVCLAVGSERGWTEAELALLRGSGFEARSLGSRILKTETAALVAVSLALAALRLL